MIKLIQLFQEPERDIDEVLGLLRRDPALAAQILRRCNSSFFGNEDSVTDVTEALFRLGFYEVYRLAVTLFGMEAISKTTAGNGLEIEAIWHHSTTTAIVGAAFGKDLGENEGIVFTAGLLHDIGKVILAQVPGRNYTALMQKHGCFGPTLSQAETAEFGFNHAEVGAWLLNRWQVPEVIAEPVFLHHRAQWEGEHGRAAAIITLANLMAHSIEATPTQQLFDTTEGCSAMKLLDLTADDMERLGELARADLKRSRH